MQNLFVINRRVQSPWPIVCPKFRRRAFARGDQIPSFATMLDLISTLR